MTEKIDTQGMSGDAVEGCTDNVYPHDENGEPILPRMMIKPDRLLTPMIVKELKILLNEVLDCLLYTSPSPRDRTRSRMPSSA